ncbi:MAG: sulfotransferase [Pirellulales bacterium]
MPDDSLVKKKETFNHYAWYLPRFWHGMTLGVWLTMLARNTFAVSWKRWHLVAGITPIAFFNTCMSALQSLLYWGRIQKTPDPVSPIFIIGHWRSGTTHLHELMIRDPRFGYATTYECFAPSHFLLSEWIAPLLKTMLPEKRPMDNMPAGWEHPQEDEFALCNLGVGSPYGRMAFPNHPNYEREYLDPADLTPTQKTRWQAGLRWFLKCVWRRCGKRLVMKSPPHTARVAALLEMFPDAKFVHITRDPRAVYPSTVRLWKSFDNLQGLQIPTFDDLEERVQTDFVRMYTAFERDRPLLNDGNLCEVRYEDLVARPLDEMERIYRTLGIENFEEARGPLETYLNAQKSYQTNKHTLPGDTEAMLEAKWGPYMRRYGYFEDAAVQA